MHTFEILTLIDITMTNVNRPNQGTQLEYNQNRNFITLRQCVELRSIVSYTELPKVKKQEIKDLGFGTNYTGSQQVWSFKFTPDRDGVYQDEDGNIFGNLLEDLNSVPIIKNLSETINIDKAMFDCINLATKNTIIKAHPGIT
jgi:hypothetical protein